MFDTLASRLQKVLAKLKTKGRLSENDVGEALREVRLALLEADVNYKVVKEFASRVRERAVGSEVMESLTPGQQVIKIVQEELSYLLGSVSSQIAITSQTPTIIMLIGLQGSGKTTAAVKLARYLRTEKGFRPIIVAADLHRPAAIQQLKTLGEEQEITIFSQESSGKPERICLEAIQEAKSKGYDAVILDTAGRWHIDEEMMLELEKIKETVKPHEILLVVDAMTGQEAVNVALGFQKRVNFDGLIFTKLDGDARGGAALSIKSVTGKPIKFVSTGEKIDNLELSHPERMASRILGMGDVLTLIEKAEAVVDRKKAEDLEKKLRKNQFDFEDFLNQLQQVKKMGSVGQLLGLMPKLPGLPRIKNADFDEKQLTKTQAIIQSMTLEERKNPHLLKGSRKKRIAKGSGTTVHDVNLLLRRFQEMKKMLGTLGKFNKKSLRIGKKFKEVNPWESG